MSGIAASDTDLRMQTPSNRIREAVCATRCIVTDPGAITVTLYGDDTDQPLAVIRLGPADAVRLASDLLLPARRHLGRP